MCVCIYFECASGQAYLGTYACLPFWKNFVILDGVHRYVACMFSYVHEYLHTYVSCALMCRVCIAWVSACICKDMCGYVHMSLYECAHEHGLHFFPDRVLNQWKTRQILVVKAWGEQ